ncbi:glycosyltransferase [Porticoccaceae bacterium]|nr:glycosyltransferase [Porticoccaceae bacterium]
MVTSVWVEPLARVCFEPKFFSVPVFASSNIGNLEVIHNNKDGLLFDFKIQDDLSAKLSFAEIFDYAYFSRNTYEDQKRFTVLRLLEAYEDI